MHNKARTTYISWRLKHLYKKILRIRQQQWIDPYHTTYGTCTDLVFLKPRYFTDETSLHNFVTAASDERMYGSKCPGLIRITVRAGYQRRDRDRYANAAPRERMRLQMTFREANRSAVITLTAETDKWGAATTITGDQSLYLNIATACVRYTKPMRFFRRHRATPLVEPIDSKEESDRRNRRETSWKSILASAMTGILAVLLPLAIKAVLHI